MMVEKENQRKRNGLREKGREIKGVGGCSGTASSMLLDSLSPHEGP